jgi:hypothetical protein
MVADVVVGTSRLGTTREHMCHQFLYYTFLYSKGIKMFLLLRKGSKNANPANRQTSSRGKTSTGRKTSLKINALALVLPQRTNRMRLHNEYFPCPFRWPNKESINCPRNNQHKNANSKNLKTSKTSKTLNNVNEQQREKQRRRLAIAQNALSKDANKLYYLQA